MKITGHIKLSHPLTVKSDCLNKEFDLTINSVSGKISTPKLPEQSQGLETGQNLEEHGNKRFFRDDFFWGRVIQWSDGRSHIYNFKTEFEFSDEKKVTEIGKELYEGLPTWILKFKDNLSALGHNLGLPTLIQNRTELEKENFDLFYKGSKGIEQPYAPTSMLNMIARNSPGIDRKNLHYAIDLTSKNKRPILELSLLSDSNISLVEGDYRKSILDSSTACELALTNCLRREIKADQPLLDEILRLNNSLSKKRNLLKIIGINLPEHNYERDLEILRNRAIHIGKDPNMAEAKTAFNISNEVVNLLCQEKFE